VSEIQIPKEAQAEATAATTLAQKYTSYAITSQETYEAASDELKTSGTHWKSFASA
jgi:hypothetical protein